MRLRIGSLFAAGLCAAGAVCVLERAELICVLDHPVGVRTAVWGLTGLFGLSVLGNLVSRSPLAQRVMMPVALVLAAAACSSIGVTAPI